MNKYYFTVLLLWPWGVFSEKLSTAQDYFNPKMLSPNNIQMNFGVSALHPPHSFKNSFARRKIVQLEYRRENRSKFTLPFLFKLETQNESQRSLEALAFHSGVQFPKTHRKTPIYFGLSLGARWNFHKRQKISFIFQISSSVLLYQFTKSTSSLLHLDANYKLGEANWWRTPESIIILAGLNMNL